MRARQVVGLPSPSTGPAANPTAAFGKKEHGANALHGLDCMAIFHAFGKITKKEDRERDLHRFVKSSGTLIKRRNTLLHKRGMNRHFPKETNVGDRRRGRAWTSPASRETRTFHLLK